MQPVPACTCLVRSAGHAGGGGAIFRISFVPAGAVDYALNMRYNRAMTTRALLRALMIPVLVPLFGGCRDRILPADGYDSIWDGKEVIYNGFNTLSQAYGPIFTLPLGGAVDDATQVATGFLLYPARARRFIYTAEDRPGVVMLHLADSGGDQVLAESIPTRRLLNFAAITDDGAEVAFMANDSAGDIVLHAVAASGGASAPLSGSFGQVAGMLFSPDSRYLAVGAVATGESQEKIFIIDWSRKSVVAEIGGAVPDLVVGIQPVYWFQWMPDGRSIIYRGYDGTSGQGIFIAPVTGGVPRLIASADYSFPTPSPGGTRVAAIRENQLWVMNADGTDARQITFVTSPTPDSPTPEMMLGPQWSADGTKILVLRARFDTGTPAALLEAVDLATLRRKVLAKDVSPGFWLE